MASGIDLISIFIGLMTMAGVHPGRLSAQPAIERSGGEVLPARRVFARHPALRHVADVGLQTTNPDHGDGVRRIERDPRLVLAVILVVAGVGFKIAAVPFICGRLTCTKRRR
jgi:hypothetical protein